ncbi:uncharacterized protein A1O9_03419, partial [Exophiala aquamarina CBS 119918]
MALQCPYQRISYATWRLQLIRTLYHTEFESRAPRSPFQRTRRKHYYSTSQHYQGDVSRRSRDTYSRTPRSLLDDSIARRNSPQNPFDYDGVSRMKGVLAEVDELRQKVGRQTFKRIAHTVPYESPVKHKLNDPHRRRHKRIATQEEIADLENNVWARILASPIRACFSSGTRLPVALLSNWSLVKEPTSDLIYTLPTELADLDAFEEKMAAEMYKEAWRYKAEEWRAAAQKRRAASGEGQTTESLDEDSNVGNSISATRPRGRHDPFSTRIFMYINYLRHLTATLGKRRNADPWKDVEKDKPIAFNSARLFNPRTREKLGAASHYEFNRTQVALATGEMERPTPESDRFDFKDSHWQPDIDDRLTRILQKRIVLAMRATAEVLDGSLRKQLERRILPLPIPRMGEFRIQRRHGYPETLRGWQGVDDLERQERKDSDKAFDESPSSQELVDEAGRPADEEAQPPPSWLPGSILLHIGKGNLEKLLVPETEPSSASQRLLPPLPRNSLIPTMVPIGGAYRIPAFSLHRFFTSSDNPNDIPESATANLKELEDIINTCASFNLSTQTATSSAPPPIPQNFFLLIKPFAGAQKNLVEEIWRLWRYVGGR